MVRLILCAAMLGGALLAGCAPADSGEVPPEVPRNVRVMAVGLSDLSEYVDISGPVRPLRGTDVSAEESGTAAEIPHDKGARVRAGDVLVVLDRRLLAADLEAARAELEVRRYDHEKSEELFAAGKISKIDLLNARNAHERARAAVEVAEVRHQRAAVKAPFAGLVTDRFVEPGQLVQPGMRVARVVDPFTLKLEASLTEREIAAVQRGAPAEVVLDGHPGTVAGEVYWIGFEADPASGKFPVEVRIPNPDLTLRAGVVGRARVLKQSHAGAVVIPRDAVVYTDKGEGVFVVEGDRARARPIALGADQGLMVIVAQGLAAGDRLVVRGQRDLIDGALVSITETAERVDGTRGDEGSGAGAVPVTAEPAPPPAASAKGAAEGGA